MKVSEIMNKPIVIEKNISVKEAARTMSDKNIGSLIIISNDKILGIITEDDILKNIDNLTEKISKVMSKKVVTIDKDNDIEYAAKLMAANKIKRLPVLKNNELVGIITATDIIAHSEDIDEDFFFE